MKPHGGRLQVQGRDLPGAGHSWSWSQDWPPRARTGIRRLRMLRKRLAPSQLERREVAFLKAERWIREIRDGVGPPQPTTRSFRNPGLPSAYRSARVDIEINRGTAFHRDILRP